VPDDLPVDPEDEPTPDPDLPPDPDAEPDDGGSETRREGLRELTVGESEFVVSLIREGCTGYGRVLLTCYRQHFPHRCNVGPQQLRKNAHAMYDRPNIQAELGRQQEIMRQEKTDLDAARAQASFNKSKAISETEAEVFRGYYRTIRTIGAGVKVDKHGNTRVPLGTAKLYELGFRVTNNLTGGEPTVSVNVGSGAAEEITERLKRMMGQKGIMPPKEEGKA
jgi:hypothetical protein